MSDTDDEIDNLAKHLAKQMRGKDVAIVNQIKALDVLTKYATAKRKHAGKTGSVTNFNKFREVMQDVAQKDKRHG